MLTVDAEKANYPQEDESLISEVPKNIHVHTTKTSDPYVIYSLFGRKAPSSGFANESVQGVSGYVKKLARFIRGNVFIPDPRKGWNKFAIKKAAELIKTHGLETIITTSPPHSTQLIGLELKKKYGVKWVADMRDPWTKIYYVSELLQTKWAQNKNANLERTVLENADSVITVSQSLASEFCELAPRLKPENIEVISNGFDEDDFQFDVPLDKQFTIGYMGTITEQYDVTALLKTVGLIEDDVAFRFIGDAPAQVRNQTEEVSTKTEFTGYLNHYKAIEKAALNLREVALKTPLVKNNQYSQKYQSTILFKREDLQQVRSYKIRGAYNKISSLTEKQRAKGIICASAGNHAQGVALSCKLLKIYGVIYMPSPTPKQKINQVKN